MKKSQVVIGPCSVFLLIGILLGVRVLNRFGPVLDGDSIIPDAISVLSDFTVWDYFFVSLMAGSVFIGLFMLLGGIIFLLKKTKDI